MTKRQNWILVVSFGFSPSLTPMAIGDGRQAGSRPIGIYLPIALTPLLAYFDLNLNPRS